MSSSRWRSLGAVLVFTLLCSPVARAQSCGPDLPPCPDGLICIVPQVCEEPPCVGTCEPLPCGPGGTCPAGMSCDPETLTCRFGSDGTPPGVVEDQGIEYFHRDAIGSVRLVTNENGEVVSRHDYLPFGEEIQPGINGRAQVPGYDSSSGTRHRFTGKERDFESGFDYFGARYFGSSMGRFTTVDPSQTWEPNLRDPQRWNRYSYARNNPARFLDPDGREVVPYESIEWAEADRAAKLEILRGIGKALANVLLALNSPGHMTPEFEAEYYYRPDSSAERLAMETTDFALLAGAALTRASAQGKGFAIGERIPGGAIAGEGPGAALARGPTVIGKLKDLQNLRPGENTLLEHLQPSLGGPKANWARNSGVLRREMAKGRPIRDASVNPNGTLRDDTGFLGAERNLLEGRGWKYDPSTQLWSPP